MSNWTPEQVRNAQRYGICSYCRTPFQAGWIKMEDGNTGTGRYCATPDCPNHEEPAPKPELPEHLRSDR